MGLDIKAALDAIVAQVSQNYVLLLVVVGLLVLFSSKGVFARVRSSLEKALTDNWQLTLLASTGVALSLASGYTTFDGLRNFTNAPLLSVAISFGIQGVMLIVAWLIGESFAVGLNQRTAEGGRTRMADVSGGMLLGLVFVGRCSTGFCTSMMPSASPGRERQRRLRQDPRHCGLLPDPAMLVVLIAFGLRRGGEIATPYMQSIRLIAKNSVLWVMFLATMGASVFFSFDSHFNAIFPADQRKRAAEIRTTGQIGGVIADVGALTQKRQLEEAEHLFDTDGWKAYDKQLTSLAQVSQGAQGEIEKFFVQQMEERRRAIAQQQERIATAHSGQAGLAVKKLSLTDELSRLKGDRPGLAAEYGRQMSEIDAKAKEIDGKRVEALAEDRGVEGTLKQGRGPVYRERMTELTTLQDQLKIKQERAKDAQKRLSTAEARIAQIERELSTVDGDLAKLKGEAETADQRIKVTQAANGEEEGGKLDPARILPSFERARVAFRQQPDTERLGVVQAQCTNLVNAMSSTQATKEKVRAIDCDPEGGGRGGRSRVRAQCGSCGLPFQLRRRRQARQDADDGCAAGVRTQMPAGFRSRQCQLGQNRRQAVEHRHEPRRQGASLRRLLERVSRRQPARLSVADARHRRRRAGLHVGPVWRQCAALDIVGCTQPTRPEADSSSRPLSRGAAARYVQQGEAGARGHVPDGSRWTASPTWCGSTSWDPGAPSPCATFSTPARPSAPYARPAMRAPIWFEPSSTSSFSEVIKKRARG